MKKYFFLILIALLILSFKNHRIGENSLNQLSIAEKIAKAHGHENWEHISEIAFTFNGKRNWIWKPKTSDVTSIIDSDTIFYNTGKIDTTLTKIDRGFINDKFWILIPFQLVWDQGTTISDPILAEAPISKTKINKITLTYPNEGGYTPGDAYDIYYSDDYIIREWVFRKGNNPEPSLINTFENYQDFYGIKIALDHKKADGKTVVSLTNVSIHLD